MTARRAMNVAVLAMALLITHPAAAQQIPPGVGEGWNGEFDHATRQLTQLAEAIPAEKYSWRPGPGVRSTGEVFMHIALANYFLLAQAGVKPAIDMSKLGKEPERGITGKDEVIKFLKASADNVRAVVPTLDRAKPVKLFGKSVTVDSLLTRLLVHNHEHMGQLIAYARVNNVVPPWSAGSGQ